MSQVIPETLLDSPASEIAIVGTGALTYDIFPGPFKVDDAYTASPYGNFWLKLESLPGASLQELLAELNHPTPWSQAVPSYANSSAPVASASYDVVFCDFDEEPIVGRLLKMLRKRLEPKLYKPLLNTSSVLTSFFQKRPCADGPHGSLLV